MRFISAAIVLLTGLAPSAGLWAAEMEITPGQYEYTIKIQMAGAPELPLQTMQRCITPKDAVFSKSFETMLGKGSDCKLSDMVQDGARFSYKVACNKPQKMDGDVKGSFTATSLTLEMMVSMPNMPGPMNQTISARRVGDCKPATAP